MYNYIVHQYISINNTDQIQGHFKGSWSHKLWESLCLVIYTLHSTKRYSHQYWPIWLFNLLSYNTPYMWLKLFKKQPLHPTHPHPQIYYLGGLHFLLDTVPVWRPCSYLADLWVDTWTAGPMIWHHGKCSTIQQSV